VTSDRTAWGLRGTSYFVTVRVTAAVWLSEPLTPLMTSVKVPWPDLAEVPTVSVGVPDPEIVGGENATVDFDGAPVTERVTAPAKPFTDATFTV
jgi:hypothetical protein